MCQAVPPPIIRSSKLCTQHRVFVELLLLLTACAKFFLDSYSNFFNGNIRIFLYPCFTLFKLTLTQLFLFFLYNFLKCNNKDKDFQQAVRSSKSSKNTR